MSAKLSVSQNGHFHSFSQISSTRPPTIVIPFNTENENCLKLSGIIFFVGSQKNIFPKKTYCTQNLLFYYNVFSCHMQVRKSTKIFSKITLELSWTVLCSFQQNTQNYPCIIASTGVIMYCCSILF